MARTADSYIKLIEHALGSASPDALAMTSLDVLNDAGRYLFDLYDWPWKRQTADVTVDAGETELILPDDCAEIIKIVEGNTSSLKVYITTVQEILNIRANQSYDALTLYVAFNIDQGRSSDDKAPGSRSGRKRALVAPTPAVGVPAGSLTMEYVREWTEIEENDLTVVPNIPIRCERLLANIARAFVIHWEDQTRAYEDDLVITELEVLKKAYGRQQREAGPMRNTIRKKLGGARYPHSFITHT